MRWNIAAVLFGGSCFLCRGAARELLCGACDAELPRLERPLCPRCALESPRGELCGRCLSQAPAYDATQAALAERLRAERVDLVVPVPLSAQRLRRRGYNQAVEIARHLPGASLELARCERTRDAPPQIELPYEARRRNVRGAFRCDGSLDGATVAVVDDVMTTGATLDEIARTLKGAGAARVVNWVVARTMPHA
jgi:predicted amidophosphoribosyltransferase